MEERIYTLTEQIIAADPEVFEGCYAVEIRYKLAGNPKLPKVDVFVDADAGITIKQCTALNRRLQKAFDEQPAVWFGTEYSIDVSSPGVGQPLKLTRQYTRHIGREVRLTLLDGAILEGELTEADPEGITIERELEMPDPKNPKKKKREMVPAFVNFASIEKGVVLLPF